MTRILKGKKVWLRPPILDDFEGFVSLMKASRKFHQGLTKAPMDAKSFAAFLWRSAQPTDECFVICRREDDAIAGAINLSQIFRGGFQNAYLGYYLGEKFAGQGLMSEAINLILRFAFQELKLHRVEANVQPHNAASIAVLRKNGFVKEGYSRKYLKVGGRWRDHERWAIIADDFKKHRKLNDRS